MSYISSEHRTCSFPVSQVSGQAKRDPGTLSRDPLRFPGLRYASPENDVRRRLSLCHLQPAEKRRFSFFRPVRRNPQREAMSPSLEVAALQHFGVLIEPVNRCAIGGADTQMRALAVAGEAALDGGEKAIHPLPADGGDEHGP